MRFEELNREAQEYIDRYIRGKPKTREDAMKEKLVQETIRYYETKEN